jgi:hypothetical protein
MCNIGITFFFDKVFNKEARKNGNQVKYKTHKESRKNNIV